MRRILARLREQRGETTITGVLVAATILIIVLTATLTTFDTFASSQNAATDRVVSQDQARRAIDGLARDLRNLASPTPDQPEAFDLAGPRDIVFKTVSEQSPGSGANVTNTKRVRYCLDTSVPLAASLVAQTQTWTSASPPPVPSTAACPAAGWTETTTVADALVHDLGGVATPVFTMDSPILTDISSIHVDLVVDGNPHDATPATPISTGVFLRNQNRRPTAMFTATVTAEGVLLNGSASHDPEGQPLRYEWYSGDTRVGTGIVFTYAAPAGTHSLTLRVVDPADLTGTAAPQQVVV